MNGNLRNMTSVYLINGEKILLLRRIGSKVVEDNSFVAAAGGHFESAELNDARSCVLRELYEETGLTESDIVGLHMKYITMRQKNGEIRINFYFFAELVRPAIRIESSEGELYWADLSEIPTLKMPVSAKYALLHWLKTGRFDNDLYGGITEENGIMFTRFEEF